MRQKPLVGLVVVMSVAGVTWLLATAVGTQLLDTREAWNEWRGDHSFWFFLGWAGSVIVISVPLLWVIGKRMSKVWDEQERSIAAARGVGRFAMRALEGKVDAIDKLFDLLDDPTPPVRYQAARALALLDKPEVDKELFRHVRYWDGNDKLALIDTVKRGHDMRGVKLLRLFAEDRNPMVARRARTAVALVAPRATRMDDLAGALKNSPEGRAGKDVGLGEQSGTHTRRAVASKPRKSAATAAAAQDKPPERRPTVGKIGAEPAPRRRRPASVQPDGARPARRPRPAAVAPKDGATSHEASARRRPRPAADGSETASPRPRKARVDGEQPGAVQNDGRPRPRRRATAKPGASGPSKGTVAVSAEPSGSQPRGQSVVEDGGLQKEVSVPSLDAQVAEDLGAREVSRTDGD